MAKQLLNGQKIVVVRCEALNISGEFFRAKRTLYLSRRRDDELKKRELDGTTNVAGADLRDYSKVPCIPPKDDKIQSNSRR